MSDYENVSQLVSRTGATYEEARYAYEACGKDMLAAAIMLEKSMEAKKNKQNNTADYRHAWNNARSEIRSGARKAGAAAGGFFEKLCRNTLKVSGSREYFSVPLLAAVAIVLFLWEIAVPALIISFFCGIKFTFTGPDFKTDCVYGINKPESKGAEMPRYESVHSEYDYSACESNQDKGFFS